MIEYGSDAHELTERDLAPFFAGWSPPPAPSRRLQIMRAAHGIEVARVEATVVGLVTALSDGVSWAYIPLLEVMPAYRGRGIGRELVRRILHRYRDLYAIDLVCDDDIVPFYERLGMARVNAMIVRNRDALTS